MREWVGMTVFGSLEDLWIWRGKDPLKLDSAKKESWSFNSKKSIKYLQMNVKTTATSGEGGLGIFYIILFIFRSLLL